MESDSFSILVSSPNAKNMVRNGYNQISNKARLKYWKDCLEGLILFIGEERTFRTVTSDQLGGVIAEASMIHKLILVMETITLVERESKSNVEKKENDNIGRHRPVNTGQLISRRFPLFEIDLDE